jgi:hypothetical protein
MPASGRMDIVHHDSFIPVPFAMLYHRDEGLSAPRASIRHIYKYVMLTQLNRVGHSYIAHPYYTLYNINNLMLSTKSG